MNLNPNSVRTILIYLEDNQKMCKTLDSAKVGSFALDILSKIAVKLII